MRDGESEGDGSFRDAQVLEEFEVFLESFFEGGVGELAWAMGGGSGGVTDFLSDEDEGGGEEFGIERGIFGGHGDPFTNKREPRICTFFGIVTADCTDKNPRIAAYYEGAFFFAAICCRACVRKSSGGGA